MTQHEPAAGSPGTPDTLLERPARRLPPLVRDVLVHVVTAVLLGLLAGVVWNWVVDLPGWLLDGQGNATISEHGRTQEFTADYWFSIIGLVVGLVQGIWAWTWFHRRGWFAVVVAVAAAAVAALVAWQTGQAMGPSGFDERLTNGQAGDLVLIDFELRATAALAMWPLGAVIPIMIASAFMPEPDDQALRRLRRQSMARRP